MVLADPAIAFSFIKSFLGVVHLYLGSATELNDVSLRENFDIVLQLLSETFNPPYHPVSTDASALQEIVPTTSLWNKMLLAGLAAAGSASSVVGGSGSSTPTFASSSNGGGAFSSPLHWRRAGIRYAQNEVYFDIDEEIEAVLDKSVPDPLTRWLI